LKIGDIDGDGLVDVLRSSTAATSNATFAHYRNTMLSASVASHKLTKVTTGFGVETDINYKKISDDAVYTHLPAFNTLGKVNANFFSPQFGMWLVSSVYSDSHGSGSSAQQVGVKYKYSGFKIDKLGRGPQGFYEIETTDPQTNIKTTTRYHQSWPLTGKPQFTKSYAGDALITHATSTFRQHTDKQGSLFVYLRHSDEKGWQIGSDGTRRPIKRIMVTNSYDSGLTDKWGNLTSNTTATYMPTGSGQDSWTVAHITSSTNAYYTGADHLRYGRLKSSSVRQLQYAKQGLPHSSLTRKTEFTYYDNLMLKSETVAPECSGSGTSRNDVNHCDASNKYTKTLHYDAFGNVKQTDITAGSETRSSYTQYDSTGELVVRKSNALNQAVTYLYNGVSNPDGRIVSVTETSPNGISKTQLLNQWGEAVETRFADGTYQKSETLSCGSSSLCASVGGRYYTKSTQSGVAAQYQVFDVYGRNVRNTKALVDGSVAYEDITYDKHNNPITKTLPYKSGESKYTTRFDFDSYNRLKKTTLPSGKVTSVEYLGHLTRTTDVGGNNDGYSTTSYKRDEMQDVLGRTLYKTDPYTGTNPGIVNRVSFNYNAFGDVLSTINEVYNASSRQFKQTGIYTHYDRYGRKIKAEDPSRGTWQLYYNGFGDVVKEV
ncbi:toxin TcdB middle/N-terminal domain-containing protein, partial [Pseudoalteromonas rubra]|uniref:toxin TcdB middle/N-terminal domain-containing protein n=1 Tax=Pseudoalteromonas rubra TaxID=43658 RepID=UPI0013DE60BC